MDIFQADCPHCGTKSVGFTIVHQWHAHKVGGYHWDTLAWCGQCSKGVLATFQTPNSNPPTSHLGNASWDYSNALVIAPSCPDTSAPDHTPTNVARFYAQGMDNLPGNWDAAGSMFRKALETALKNKFPEIKGTLYERIEKAAKQHKLMPDLADWAHQIRLDGRNAVHEEEPFSKEEAERLSTFTKLILLYLFSLPGMIDQAQKTIPDDANHE